MSEKTRKKPVGIIFHSAAIVSGFFHRKNVFEVITGGYWQNKIPDLFQIFDIF